MTDTTSPTKLALDTLDAILSEVEDHITCAHHQKDHPWTHYDKEYWQGRLTSLLNVSDLISARIATLKDEE